MLEGGEWGGEQEIAAFLKLYNANINDFDAMVSSTSYLIAENDTLTYTIYSSSTNINNFDSKYIQRDPNKINF